jgi:Raf kinase inhibitor-like YbhB/YbcL family protein
MRNRPPSLLILTCAALFLCSCSPNSTAPKSAQPSRRQQGDSMSSSGKSFTLASTAFHNGGNIPRKYTCDDADQSPQLTWSGVPPKTQSLALIMDDPDAPAGTWTHWLIWNLPSETSSLPQSVPKLRILVSGAQQGYNDFHRIGYGGPCPPPGNLHHYYFRLYALSARLDLDPGANRAALDAAIQPHILAQTQTVGTFRR